MASGSSSSRIARNCQRSTVMSSVASPSICMRSSGWRCVHVSLTRLDGHLGTLALQGCQGCGFPLPFILEGGAGLLVVFDKLHCPCRAQWPCRRQCRTGSGDDRRPRRRLVARMEWNMSDPYSSDQPRRYGGSYPTGLWSWLAPVLAALGLLIGGIIGYNWGYGSGVEHQMKAQSGPPATTGSAPSQQRPAPGTR
jgi:hypothetical protein